MLVMLRIIITHFQKTKNKKIITQLNIITQHPKVIENPNTIDIKSVTLKHPETYLRLYQAG